MLISLTPNPAPNFIKCSQFYYMPTASRRNLRQILNNSFLPWLPHWKPTYLHSKCLSDQITFYSFPLSQPYSQASIFFFFFFFCGQITVSLLTCLVFQWSCMSRPLDDPLMHLPSSGVAFLMHISDQDLPVTLSAPKFPLLHVARMSSPIFPPQPVFLYIHLSSLLLPHWSFLSPLIGPCTSYPLAISSSSFLSRKYSWPSFCGQFTVFMSVLISVHSGNLEWHTPSPYASICGPDLSPVCASLTPVLVPSQPLVVGLSTPGH